jgi:hypothetical protein
VWANVGGAVPGEISMSTFAQSGRFTYCIGEREEDSPWEPLHVEHGCAAGDSTVARSGEAIASTTVGGLGDTLLVIAPEHATTIAADGWSKATVREFLWERMRVSVDGIAVPKFRTPGNLKIVVAGGSAGRFSAWVPGWPFRDSPSSLVIKRIALP